ncbi:hypothetical protein [Pseudomonas sp. RIT-PI-AD]|uniref:hypothetical protein n=1 Tax=Pseudomonas sp. RIT-PI-AD TaxID=3035294 RepID=UPI0021D8A889|nr:hypothetical protein [Pseudomonas sp. RIT-PI-AD]
MNAVLSLAGAMIFTLLAGVVLSPSQEITQVQAHRLLQEARADVAPLNVRHASLSPAKAHTSDVNIQAWQDKHEGRFVF